jgi:DNA-binding transcriptional LysR family regulator
MNWNDLKYFLALSREGSVSAAGRVLGVKHTTVARRIKVLEEHFGTRLFDRSANGYAMTQAAENLFGQVLLLEEKVRQVDRQASDQDAALAGPLKLTIAHELANRVIIPELKDFCMTYPNIQLQLLMTKGLVDLAAMEADVAIRMTPAPPDYLVGRELMKLRHGIYGTREVMENLDKVVNVILFRTEHEYPAWVTEHFKNAKVILRVDDVSSMAIATLSGLGISKMPCFIGDTEPSLCRLERNLEPSKWGVWVLNHVDLRATARVRACKDYLQELLTTKSSLIQGSNSRWF